MFNGETNCGVDIEEVSNISFAHWVFDVDGLVFGPFETEEIAQINRQRFIDILLTQRYEDG